MSEEVVSFNAAVASRCADEVLSGENIEKEAALSERVIEEIGMLKEWNCQRAVARRSSVRMWVGVATMRMISNTIPS